MYQITQIIDFYKKGFTAAEIRKKLNFNVGIDAIYGCLKRNDIKLRARGCRKGKPAWNKGMKLSEKQKAKLNMDGLSLGRAWNKGKTGIYSEEYLKKLRESHTGKLGLASSNWKGGISRAYKTGYESVQYKEWRRKVFVRDNYTCQDCGVRCGNGETIYVTAHHIKSFSKHPKLRFDVNNGITLCEICHCKVDKYRAKFMKLEVQSAI